jgi:hypothetical protein
VTDAQVRPWLLCRSGAAYEYGAVDCPDLNFVLDVVIPLSRINRYLGHTDDEWSVAAHAVLTSRIASWAGGSIITQRQCLHHDDAEALVGDCPTPVKRMLAGKFEEMEEAAHWAILHAAEAAGYVYEYPHPEEYRRFDRISLMAERQVLKVPTPPGRKWGYDYDAADIELIREAMPVVMDMVDDGENYGEGATRAYLRHQRMLDLQLEAM